MRLGLWIVSLVLVAAASATAAGRPDHVEQAGEARALQVSDLSKKARSDLLEPRAYGKVRQVNNDSFQLIPGSSKNVVAVKNTTSGNPVACIILKPSIDARNATAVATPLLEVGDRIPSTPACSSQPSGPAIGPRWGFRRSA
jgi:hypothetical protein